MNEQVIPSKEDPLLTVEEVAKIFSVEAYTIRNWIKQDKIKATKLGNLWRIQRSEMIRFANQEYGQVDDVSKKN